MINTKTQEKTQQPRLFELWNLIVNGSEQENKNKKEVKK